MVAMRIDEFTDITYSVEEDTYALVTINRPERLNAFRGRTVDELISAFKHAWVDPRVAAVILTGAGDRAFCSGGDVKERAETGSYGETEWGTFEIERLHRIMRDIPKPVIAAVNGVAMGGGHVLHVLADLTVAADHATFGQAGPRVGSFDAGFGSAYLARVVGEKRARQIWFLLDRYDAATAERWGLVLADGHQVPEALVQRRHRSHRRHLHPRLRRARVVRPRRGGQRGRAGVCREAPSGLSPFPLRRPPPAGTVIEA
jgi:naphthoate synthase